MASSLSGMKLFSELKIQMFDHDPGATTAVLCSPDGGTTIKYADMRDYGTFAAIAMASTLTGNGITKLEIVASAAVAFSSVVVVKDSGTVAADAVGDYVVEECTAEELAQLSSDNSVELRYVAARLTCQNAADEAVVTYIQGNPRWPQSGLTADTIS